MKLYKWFNQTKQFPKQYKIKRKTIIKKANKEKETMKN